MKISGYTQSYNLKSQHYPWRESIQSLLGFCDEVIIVDGGSTDGTYEELLDIAKLNTKVKPFIFKRDWNQEGFSLFNGQQKAEARKRCSGDWCFQVDIDEIIHENHYEIITEIAKNCPKEIELLCFPFVEFWGLKGKIRSDFMPLKNRMSRNTNITHGVPINQRAYTKNGRMYSLGSDGDCYIRKDTLEAVQSNLIFDASSMSRLHQSMIHFRNSNIVSEYERYYNNLIDKCPTIFHYSWANLERKMLAYKNFWQKHWNDLYDKNIEDTSENNMFFDKPWSLVTDEEIKNLSVKLEKEMCGWIFHQKIDFSKPYPNLFFKGYHPLVMKDWIASNE